MYTLQEKLRLLRSGVSVDFDADEIEEAIEDEGSYSKGREMGFQEGWDECFKNHLQEVVDAEDNIISETKKIKPLLESFMLGNKSKGEFGAELIEIVNEVLKYD